jgi:RNA polymerase sigma factor (sigma-70 family)
MTQIVDAVSTASTCAEPAEGHERWFKEEVHAHEGQLRAYLHGSFPAINDVDDLVQESYLRIWRRQLRQPIRSAKGFLYKIARHLAIDRVRGRRRNLIDGVADLSVLDVMDGKPGVAEAACTSEELELLVEAIDSLPSRCREILILRKLRGLSQKEIALRLGIAERTVEVQGTKGLDRCEAFLRRRGLRQQEGA